MDSSTKFWVCVVFTVFDVFLAAIAPLPELRTLFLISGACFALGAMVNSLEVE